MDRDAAWKREAGFLSYVGDVAAVYRFDAGEMAYHVASLEQARLDGESPIISGYDLISTGPIKRGADTRAILDEYRANSFVKPGDIVAFKQAGKITCWHINQLACSNLPGLLNRCPAAAKMSVESNYNKINGIINNEPPKPSVLDTLRQYREETEKAQGGTVSPSRKAER